MEKTNYAAIDIGSNAVRLLIKSVDMEEGTASFVKSVELQYLIFEKSNKDENEKKS